MKTFAKRFISMFLMCMMVCTIFPFAVSAAYASCPNCGEYCSDCGTYIDSGTSHGSTYTEWSGCSWYDYCRDCDELMGSGTSHGSYSYTSWEYYNSSRHYRTYACSNCGEGSYEYGYHSTSSEYSQYSSTQHKVGSYCSTCSSYVGSTSYESHDFSYGSWTNYSGSQHRRSVYCSDCGYSDYEYSNHSLSYGSWTSTGSSQHKRTVSCSCGYSTTETASHHLTYGSWTNYSGTQHKRTVSCSGCSYSTTEYASHSLTRGSWSSISDTQHSRTVSCSCGYSGTETESHDFSYSYGDWTEYSSEEHSREVSCECGYSGTEYDDHTDSDIDGSCDECGYITSRFSVGEKILNLGEGFFLALESPLPSFHPFDLCVGIAIAVIFRLIVYGKSKNVKKYRRNEEYGSARWGRPEDIVPYMDEDFRNNVILTNSERLTMNNRPKDPKTARNKNVLIVGGSGSGKTRFWLKPNLVQCNSEKYPVSFVVTDPKASLLTETGKMLQRYGYTIKVLNTINFKKSMKYNPFAYIHSEKDILKLVTCLISNTKGEGKGGDAFWEKAETLLCTALIGYIWYEGPEEERNFTTLINLINMMEVREDDETFENDVDILFKELKAKDPNHFAVRQYAKYKLAAGKTAKSIVSDASGIMVSDATLNFESLIPDLESRLEAMELGELFGIWMQSFLVGICMHVLTICMAIYAALVQNIAVTSDISYAIWTCMGYTVLLCFSLFKTGSLAKSLLGAH